MTEDGGAAGIAGESANDVVGNYEGAGCYGCFRGGLMGAANW